MTCAFFSGETFPREELPRVLRGSGEGTVNPAMAVMNGKLYVTWFTEGANDPAIYLAVSSDGGKTFAPRTKLSV